MSDFKQWYTSQEGDVCHDYDEGLKIWNASRAALIGDVEPVAWCLRYNDPRCGPIHSNPSMYKPELEAQECVTSGIVSVENLFTADQLTTAIANERERAAKLIDQTDLSKLPDEWKLPVANILMVYAEAIRGIKP